MEKHLQGAGGASSGVIHQVASSPRLRTAVNQAAQSLGISSSALFRVALGHYIAHHPQVDPQLAAELIEATKEIGVRVTKRRTVDVAVVESAAAYLPHASSKGEG